MTVRHLRHALLLLAAPSAAFAAQPATAPPATTTEAAAPSGPVNDQAAQDRIMSLVRARKCGAARTEAKRVGDLSLADQIDVMCDAHSSNPFAKPGGGGAGGRRNGGSSGRPG